MKKEIWCVSCMEAVGSDEDPDKRLEILKKHLLNQHQNIYAPSDTLYSTITPEGTYWWVEKTIRSLQVGWEMKEH